MRDVITVENGMEFKPLAFHGCKAFAEWKCEIKKRHFFPYSILVVFSGNKKSKFCLIYVPHDVDTKRTHQCLNSMEESIYPLPAVRTSCPVCFWDSAGQTGHTWHHCTAIHCHNIVKYVIMWLSQSTIFSYVHYHNLALHTILYKFSNQKSTQSAAHFHP